MPPSTQDPYSEMPYNDPFQNESENTGQEIPNSVNEDPISNKQTSVRTTKPPVC